MSNSGGFAEDGKRGKKAWSIDRRAKRKLKRTDERTGRKFVGSLARIAHLDDLTRMRLMNLILGLFHGDSQPPPLQPA